MNPTEELKDELGSMDPPTVRRLLDSGADINVQDKDGATVLMKAVYQYSLKWCTELLERGAGLYVRDHKGKTAWEYLGAYDRIPYYSVLLQYGADVNQYSPMGWTALHRACRWNYHALILFLLAQGADPRLPVMRGEYEGKTAYDLDPGSFWGTPVGIRTRLRWDTISIQEVFILASERGLVPIPSYLW